MKKIAVYPGSFDPITNGHIDIINRALKAFDELIVLVAINPNKKSTFSLEERVQMIKDSLKELGIKNVEVDCTSGLTVDYARKVGAVSIVRGLRAVTDFEYEFQIAAVNKNVDPSIDMVFFMATSDFMFISSSTIKELFNGGADISRYVPKAVQKAMEAKLKKD
jgi:pantetheine-phosphate adenylyltransferase